MSSLNNYELTVPDNFDLPFVPYSIQQDFMTSLYGVLENKQLGIFESPTGTVSFKLSLKHFNKHSLTLF